MEHYYTNLIYLMAFAFGGIGFAVSPFILVHLLSARRTRHTDNRTGQYIECGIEPIGDAWIRYSAVYYRYALIFIAFAVDILYLIPVAIVYDRVDLGVAYLDLIEVTIFTGILSLVLVYAWKKGVFEWTTRQT